jgi:VWFA-related protein
MTLPKTRALWTTAALSLAAATLLTAQTPAPRPGQTTVFRLGTDVVSTHVTVRDARGNFIPDLSLKEFEVYEDGRLQTISTFVPIIGGRAMTEVTTKVEPIASEGLILPRTARTPPTQGRIFIVFIDDLHLQPLDSIRAKNVLKQIRDIVLHDDDLVGLVSSGFSSVSFDLNPDPKRLRFNQAIEKTMGAGQTPYETIQATQTVDGPSGLRHAAMVAFKTAYEILAQAEKVTNRRKAFIYLSSGYDFNPFTEARYAKAQEMYGSAPLPVESGRPDREDPITAAASTETGIFRNPFEMFGQQFAEADLAAAMGELVRRARRADVTFYAVDPRGLVAGADISVRLSSEEWHKFYNNSVSSLEVISNETGGFCICRNNDFKAGLQRIDNDMSDYYMIGYVSNNPDPSRARRRIEVKVTRPEARDVTYKDWYTIDRRRR